MIRPKTGQVLLRIITPMESKSGIVFGQHTITPEEQMQLNHEPTPPPPIRGRVLAIGPWKQLGNGMKVPPPFPPNVTVLIRDGSGTKLTYGTDEKLRLVKIEDVLAVLSEE